MGVPVFVFAQATPPTVVDMRSGYSTDDFRSEPIGYLRGFEAEIEDHEMVRKEIEALGLTLRYSTRVVRARNGCVGVLVGFVVEVARWEDAEALPGFVPLGHWTGACFMLPENLGSVVVRVPEDEFEGTVVKRCAVADHYKGFEPPLYDDDGFFDVSLRSLGQLGTCVFSAEDPLHFYVVQFTRDPRGLVKRFMGG